MLGDYGRFSQKIFVFAKRFIVMKFFPKICVRQEQMGAAACKYFLFLQKILIILLKTFAKTGRDR